MKNKLTILNFSVDKVNDYSYYSCKKTITRQNIPVEITLEPCANGFDIALYDQSQNLLAPKQCTNTEEYIDHLSVKGKGNGLIETVDMANAINKAIRIANQMLNNYINNIKEK